MKILICSGQSKSNKSWQENLRQKLCNEVPAAKILLHEYKFWVNMPPTLSERQLVDREVASFEEQYRKKDIDIVIGKSFGAYVALAKSIGAKQLILFGLPIKGLADYDIDLVNILQKTSTPIHIINHSHDPQLDSLSLSSLMTQNAHIKNMFIKNQADHVYDDLELYAQLIKHFIKDRTA
jgi:hypothetical protein